MFDRTLFTSLATKRASHERPSSQPVWPLPRLDGQPPVLLIFDQADFSIAMAYEKNHQSGGAMVRSTIRETTHYNIPRPTPVFAISDGVVIEVRERAKDHYRITVDHGDGWITIYDGLDHSFVASCPSEVTTGAPLGVLAATRAGPLRPLELELWRAYSFHDHVQLDPLRYVRRWQQLAWRSDPLAVVHTVRTG